MSTANTGDSAGDTGSASDAETQWWFCLKHLRVEYGPGCPGKVRMGPYDSEAAAAGALEQARQRNQQWRDQGNDD